MAKNRILFVDDEPDLLEGIERMLFRERKRWQMQFAPSGKEGLALVAKEAKKPFDVVIADMRMPHMDGVQFLQEVQRATPDTVRMMLTGNTDQETAIKAVNDGNVFRFMTKPVERETLIKVIEAGLEQYRLITAEKELLSGTLSGSVRLLTELLALSDAKVFGHGVWLRDSVRSIGQTLNIASSWEVAIAAMLSRIGYVTLPPDLATKAHERRELSKEEQAIVGKLPQIGSRLLSRIPRLENVARIILYQDKNYDGSGFPDDKVAEDQIPMGARVIRILNDLAHLSASEMSKYKLLKIMKERRGSYDPALLEQLFPLFVSPHAASQVDSENAEAVPVRRLRVGDKVVANVETQDGKVIVAAGNRVSPTFMEKIEISASLQGIKEPVYIEKALAGAGEA